MDNQNYYGEENNENLGENFSNNNVTNDGNVNYTENFGTSSYSEEPSNKNEDSNYNREVTSITKKENKNIFKSNGVLIVMAILFALTIGVAIGSMSKTNNSASSNIEGEIYSNIIKTAASSNSNEEFSIRDIAKLTENSVVEITTESVVRGRILGQYVAEGAGSGVIISSDGYIVTNNHVVENANKIMVKLKNGDIHEANIIGRSGDADVAVIKIDAKDLQPVVVGDSSKLVVGDTAVVVGNPLGSGFTVTNGIISAMDREIDINGWVANLLQTNAAINPGNSGGGLFNGKAELVGIVVAKSAGSDIEGIGFAIPINDVRDIISEIKTYGYIRGRVQLGVNLLEIEDTWDAMIYRLDSLGVYVRSVEEDSDAEKAGIKSGDRIVSIDGKIVKEVDDVKKVLSEKSPGDKVTLVISRNGKENTIKITLSEYKGV